MWIINDSESFVDIDDNSNIESISVDPEFKILKEISSIKVENETRDFQLKRLLYNQMKNGETIIERINALRLLKNQYSEDGIRALYRCDCSRQILWSSR